MGRVFESFDKFKIKFIRNNSANTSLSPFARAGIFDIISVSDKRYENAIWDIGDLRNGQSKQLNIVCKVRATGEFTNYASVWAEETDPDLTNNDDEAYTPFGDLLKNKN